MHSQIANPIDQPIRIFRGIIHIAKHQVFDHEFAILDRLDLINRVMQLCQRCLLAQWDDLFTSGLISGMQTESQIQIRKSLCQTKHPCGNADRRNQYRRRRTSKVIWCRQQLNRFGHVHLVVQRFAHPHEDDVAQPPVFTS